MYDISHDARGKENLISRWAKQIDYKNSLLFFFPPLLLPFYAPLIPGLGGLKGQKLPFHNESHKQESCYGPVSSSPFSPSSIPPTLLVNSLVTVHTTLLSSSIPQATPSSFNMLAELEAIRHKRDEAAQQNEAPVAGSVEGQSVPVKVETLVGKWSS